MGTRRKVTRREAAASFRAALKALGVLAGADVGSSLRSE
jgi:hypothetical protein